MKYYEFTTGEDLDWKYLAKRAGYSTSRMSEIKLGKRPPRLAEGIDLAYLLGVRPEWLLLDSGPMIESSGVAVDSHSTPLDDPTPARVPAAKPARQRQA